MSGDSRTISGRIRNPVLRGQIADIVVNAVGVFTSYTYVDGSLAERDVSIAWLNDNKADIGDIPTDFYSQEYIDGSLNAKADLTDIPTDFYSQEYVDGSLNAKADADDVYSKTYIDGSLNAKADLSDIPTDFYSQEYVDGSLNAKQDLIPDGTFLKESSIGSGFEWNAGMLDVPAGSGDVTQAYVDGSLAERDTSIAYLDTNKADKTEIPTDFYSQAYVDGSLSIRDTSISNNRDLLNIHDASIGDLETDITDLYTYIDGSLSERDTSIAWLDANKLEQSDLADYTTFDYVDGSLNAKADADDVYSKTYIDGSLNAKADTGDIPTDFYSQEYVDGSLNAKADLTDIPTDFYSQAYVDGSLAERDTSIAWLNTNKLEQSDLADYPLTSYVDGSLSLRDTSIAYLDTNKQDTLTGLDDIPDVSLGSIGAAQDGSSLVYSSDGYWTYGPGGSGGGGGSTTLSALTDVSVADVSTDDILIYNENGYWTYAETVNLSDTYAEVSYIDGSLGLRDTSIAWLNTNKLGITSTLDDISDVSLGSIGAPQDGSALVYNSDGYWEYGVAGGGGGGSTTLSALTDVSVAGRTDGDFLYYNNDTSTWDNITPLEGSLYFLQGSGDIGDVSVAGIGTAQDGSALVWVADGSFWSYGVAGGSSGESELYSLTDVSIAGRTDGDLLQYNNDTSTWDNITPVEAADYFPEIVSAPDSSTADGSIGQISYDSSYFYICVSSNIWGRATLSYDF